jgi:ribonuclease HI
MLTDPHALKIYIDGSALKNPGGPGGCAGIAEFPDAWNRLNEILFQEGYKATTNNRMELIACIRAFEYVLQEEAQLRGNRVQVITDSLYVHDNHRRAHNWRRNEWRTTAGPSAENPDLWKEFLSVQSRVRVRTEVHWSEGKTSPIQKEVDRSAKEAARRASRVDWGFRPGKVARSKVGGKSAAAAFPASGQEVAISIYRKQLSGKTENKVFFHVYSEEDQQLVGKFRAYAALELDLDLHRGHTYKVRFNSNPRNPTIEAVIQEVFFKKSGPLEK